MTQIKQLWDLIILNQEGKQLVLEMALPYSEGRLAEEIVVPFEYIPLKLEYITQNYNEALEMKHNKKVKIIGFYLK